MDRGCGDAEPGGGEARVSDGDRAYGVVGRFRVVSRVLACSVTGPCGLAQFLERGGDGTLTFAWLGMVRREVFGMLALARAGRTYVGVDRSVMLGAGMAWTEAEKPWELHAEGLVDDHGESFGVASSERVFDFVTEYSKLANTQKYKRTTHTLSSRCETSLNCHWSLFISCRVCSTSIRECSNSRVRASSRWRAACSRALEASMLDRRISTWSSSGMLGGGNALRVGKVSS